MIGGPLRPHPPEPHVSVILAVRHFGSILPSLERGCGKVRTVPNNSDRAHARQLANTCLSNSSRAVRTSSNLKSAPERSAVGEHLPNSSPAVRNFSDFPATSSASEHSVFGKQLPNSSPAVRNYSDFPAISSAPEPSIKLVMYSKMDSVREELRRLDSLDSRTSYMLLHEDNELPQIHTAFIFSGARAHCRRRRSLPAPTRTYFLRSA